MCKISKTPKKMSFEQAHSDPCIYTASGGEIFLIAVYVDDIALAGRSDQPMKLQRMQLQRNSRSKI